MRFFTSVCFAMLMLVSSATAQDRFPEGPGKAAVLKVCQGCHPADVAASKAHTREEWERTVTNMINAGAVGTDDEFNQIVDYLTKYFPKLPKVSVNKASVEELTAGLQISSKEADAIIVYRQKNGDFKSADDLKKVPDLDYSKIAAAKERLVF